VEDKWYEFFLHNQRGRLLEWILLARGNERIFTVSALVYREIGLVLRAGELQRNEHSAAPKRGVPFVGRGRSEIAPRIFPPASIGPRMAH
jgi:hypothetical protein